MTCQNCGVENPQASTFCENCGTLLAHSSFDPLLDTTSDSNRPRNKILIFGAITAGALACLCACTLLAGWFYFSQNTSAASVQPTRRFTATRLAALPSPTAELTDEPTATPTALSTTPTPAGKNWTTSQVINAFRRAKLEISNPRSMTNDDYGNVPHLATESIRFFLPTLGGQKGGRIYDFATANDLRTVKAYYTSGASGAALPPWIFVKDNILVQITGDLPENRAKQYQAALNSLQ